MTNACDASCRLRYDWAVVGCIYVLMSMMTCFGLGSFLQILTKIFNWMGPYRFILTLTCLLKEVESVL